MRSSLVETDQSAKNPQHLIEPRTGSSHLLMTHIPMIHRESHLTSSLYTKKERQRACCSCKCTQDRAQQQPTTYKKPIICLKGSGQAGCLSVASLARLALFSISQPEIANFAWLTKFLAGRDYDMGFDPTDQSYANLFNVSPEQLPRTAILNDVFTPPSQAIFSLFEIIFPLSTHL